MNSRQNIFVFKTNIESEEHINVISHLLNNSIHISKWNVDTQDIDKVLRIESSGSNQQHIIHLIKEAGFHCEELED